MTRPTPKEAQAAVNALQTAITLTNYLHSTSVQQAEDLRQIAASLDRAVLALKGGAR
jgi:hypothetical protein